MTVQSPIRQIHTYTSPLPYAVWLRPELQPGRFLQLLHLLRGEEEVVEVECRPQWVVEEVQVVHLRGEGPEVEVVPVEQGVQEEQ